MKETKIDISKYKNSLSRKNQIIRFFWNIVWPFCTWFLPRSLGMPWKRFLLRLFGAQIAKTANIYTPINIYYPSHLIMGDCSCLDINVTCYNVDVISIGDNSTVSQGTFLCTASHDITDPANHLITSPITIEDQAWIAAEAFIHMGTTIHQGAVIGARSVVSKDVDPWTVVAGNPAKFIKKREIK